MEDKVQCGQPSTSRTNENVERIWEFIQQHRHLTTHNFWKEMNLLYRSCQHIFLEDLNMWKISAKFVQLLTDKGKIDSICITIFNKFKISYIACQMSLQAMKPGFRGTIQKQNSSHHNGNLCSHHVQRRPRQVQWNVNSALITFFDCDTVMHHKFVSPVQTVTPQSYTDMLQHVHKNINRKQSGSSW